MRQWLTKIRKQTQHVLLPLQRFVRLDFNRQSFEISIINFKVKRRIDGSTKQTELLNFRISFLKGYRYITIHLTPFITIDFKLYLRA